MIVTSVNRGGLIERLTPKHVAGAVSGEGHELLGAILKVPEIGDLISYVVSSLHHRIECVCNCIILDTFFFRIYTNKSLEE